MKAPLAIAHTESSMGWGGQELRTLTEAAGFMRRGHRVVVYASRNSRMAAEARRFDVPVIALPIGRKRLQGVRSLVAAFAERPVDVVNAHSSTDAWLADVAPPREAGSDRHDAVVHSHPAWVVAELRKALGPRAEEIQDLFLAGKKAEAIAAVPDDLVRNVSLVGPKGFVKERLAAYAGAGVTTMLVHPLATDSAETVKFCEELVSLTR